MLVIQAKRPLVIRFQSTIAAFTPTRARVDFLFHTRELRNTRRYVHVTRALVYLLRAKLAIRARTWPWI